MAALRWSIPKGHEVAPAWPFGAPRPSLYAATSAREVRRASPVCRWPGRIALADPLVGVPRPSLHAATSDVAVGLEKLERRCGLAALRWPIPKGHEVAPAWPFGVPRPSLHAATSAREVRRASPVCRWPGRIALADPLVGVPRPSLHAATSDVAVGLEKLERRCGLAALRWPIPKGHEVAPAWPFGVPRPSLHAATSDVVVRLEKLKRRWLGRIALADPLEGIPRPSLHAATSNLSATPLLQ